MNASRTLGSAVAFLAIASTPALAASDTWSIDSAHSTVQFQIKNMLVTQVVGKFLHFGGTVNYDGKNLANAVVDATVDVDSIDTHINKRDHHLKSKDFFDAGQFPKITFKSEKVIPGQAGAFEIVGELSMHGTSKRVTLDAQPLKESGIGQAVKLTTSATTAISRRDFGIGNGPMAGMIGDTVHITLNVQLVKSE